MGVLVQPVGHLVGGIILEAQRRIVHNTHFHIGNIITGAGHGIADIYHAVQGRCFVQQGQGLGHGQVLDTPGGNDGVAFLGQFHTSRAKAKETVCPSENVLFCFAVGTGDAERGVGCIVIRGGIKQIFVVICLIQLISFHGVNEEAAVLSGDADLQITVGQLQFIGCSPLLGSAVKNTETGLFGTLDAEALSQREWVELGNKNEVREGAATIRCTLDEGGIQEYTIEIVHIYRVFGGTTKNMLLKVTDEALLAKTGGIVQGMSGSPIFQNGKLVGAVTHVLVNDPTSGYGIFIENMLDNAAQMPMAKAS